MISLLFWNILFFLIPCLAFEFADNTLFDVAGGLWTDTYLPKSRKMRWHSRNMQLELLEQPSAGTKASRVLKLMMCRGESLRIGAPTALKLKFENSQNRKWIHIYFWSPSDSQFFELWKRAKRLGLCIFSRLKTSICRFALQSPISRSV